MTEKGQQIEKDTFIGPVAKIVRHQDVKDKTPFIRRQPKAPFWKQNEEEPPKEKQISEAELQLKNMLQKQLDTNITLESELGKKKQFLPSSVFQDDQERRSGSHTLESFKQSVLQKEPERMGSNKVMAPEIILTSAQERHGSGSSVSFSSEPHITKTSKQQKDSLEFDNSFSNAKEMTRHEIEIEQSLYRGTKKADQLKHLIKAKTHEYAEDDPVMKTLQEYEEREARKRKHARKSSARKLPSPDEESSSEEENNGGEMIGPVLAPLHVRVKPIADMDVKRNRLTVEEIKSIKKFCNYEPGNPSKKLYLKNLPRNTTKEDLASIFIRYETMDMPCMEYRVLDGRMRGQAFITFPDELKAAEALKFANGYILNGKPIIISFGRDGKSN